MTTRTHAYISVGIDEVGRGALAGPVYVCAFGMRLTEKELLSFFPNGLLKDSKKLTEKEREVLYKKLRILKKEGGVYFEVGKESPSYIDTHGLTKAITSSLNKALISLQKKVNIPTNSIFVCLDGGLRAPKTYQKQETIVKGDEKVVQIACASIVAKVLRDKYMKRVAKIHPQYGFEYHVGYGTEKHRRAIQNHGITKEHRLLFLRNMRNTGKIR